MSEGKLISARKYTRRREQRRRGQIDQTMRVSWGCMLFYLCPPEQAIFLGSLFSFSASCLLLFFFSKTETPRLRPPVLKRSRPCLLSLLSRWSWLFFPHSGTVIYDKKTSPGVGVGIMMPTFLEAFPPSLASCLLSLLVQLQTPSAAETGCEPFAQNPQ